MVGKLKMEDFESYGEEMSDLVKLTNQQATEIGRLKDRVENVGQLAYRSAESKFYDELKKLVPDWETINRDPAFLDWLEEVDTLTGRKRQQLLDSAQDSLNANRVTNFFNAFKGSGGTFDQGSSESEPERKASTITQRQYTKAVKDAQTGRITEEEFNKIANKYQRQISGAS